MLDCGGDSKKKRSLAVVSEILATTKKENRIRLREEETSKGRGGVATL